MIGRIRGRERRRETTFGFASFVCLIEICDGLTFAFENDDVVVSDQIGARWLFGRVQIPRARYHDIMCSKCRPRKRYRPLNKFAMHTAV